ncbi:hypothetical protein P170DRAFT_374000 [Aspergillus steynii IBT 23096]|uniref:Uncharacterized protein n=1 Tax=Aspergillus steynii IBT 23096 TaxID=1392250 RepID=A0A2I2GP59_9EURO|nr:uncharacterized protein P170DRAFT_374000 [Aspergillus steynii IBT 23096]PLB54664.1 hypothetical protein P170DRAFT_374000 [Aspergillus steynii IBT 23096]
MSLLRNCRTAAVQVRGFASSSSLRSGPESPRYIDVPQMIQEGEVRNRSVKGTLPVPRDLFPARRADKPSKEYLDAATPLPSKEVEIDPNDPHAQYIGWKRRMADMRRKNLRQGLTELHRRKKQTDQRMMQESAKKQAQRQAVLDQPDRLDEQLTRPSIVQHMLSNRNAVLPDPTREERLALSRARFEAHNARKQVEQEDAMHTLYMNARNFITTEAQLAAEIERVFPEGENPAWRNDHQPGENVWNLGTPSSLQSITNMGRRSESGRWGTIQERVKELGEEITGGKF